MASSVIQLPRQASPYRVPLSSNQRLHDEAPGKEVRFRDRQADQLERLRDDTLPELERIERMLTRLVISYGLEYCHLGTVSTSFLDFSRAARRLLNELQKAKSCDDGSSATLDAAQHSAYESLSHFRDVIARDLTCREATPIYRKLIATLVTFESTTRCLFTVPSSEDARTLPR